MLNLQSKKLEKPLPKHTISKQPKCEIDHSSHMLVEEESISSEGNVRAHNSCGFKRVDEGSGVFKEPGHSSRPRGETDALVPCSRTPKQEEIEEFFAVLEDEPTTNVLCDRYNYDFVNDVPLPGRFEWKAEPGLCLGMRQTAS